MISALFNLLCVGSFATFGLTCSLVHKLCCRRCGRKYPAIKDIPCSCDKYTPSRKTSSVSTNTSSSSQKSNNQRRSSINDNKENIPKILHPNYNSDISVDSRNSLISQEPSDLENGIERDECSCNSSKCEETNNTFAPTSNTLSYNSDIFNKFTVSSTGSDLSNNINTFINSCLKEENSDVCNVGRKESLNDSTTRENSCTCTSEESVKLYDKKFEPNVSKGSSCKSNEENSIGNQRNSDSRNSEIFSFSIQTNSCCSSIDSDISDLVDQFQEKVKLNELPKNLANLDVCCILKPNSNLVQSGSTYEFSDSSNSAIINLMRPISCKCGRYINSDEDEETSYSIIQCKPKTDTFKSGDSEDIAALDCYKRVSEDFSEFLDDVILNSLSVNENNSLDSMQHTRQSNQFQEKTTQCSYDSFPKQEEKNSFSKNTRSEAIGSRESIPPTTIEIQAGTCYQKDPEYDEKNSQSPFNLEPTSSNENAPTIVPPKIRESNASAINNFTNTKSTSCNDECQTECCTKCSCAQTRSPKKYETTSQTINMLPTLCSSECQTECCRKCNCAAQTISQSHMKKCQAQNTISATLCSGECQTECCTKCSCAQITAQKSPRRNSQGTCSDECQKNCCSKCDCTQTTASECYKQKTVNRIVPALCNSQCQTDCCPKCECARAIDPDSSKNEPETTDATPLKVCSSKCQTDCFSKCSCSPTESLEVCKKNPDKENKMLSTNCGKCLKNCCSKCSCIGSKSSCNGPKIIDENSGSRNFLSGNECTPSVALNIYRKMSEATDKILSKKWSSECKMKCNSKCECNGSKCSCTQTIASNIYRKISDTIDKLLSTKWSSELETDPRTRNKNTLSPTKCSNTCAKNCSTKCKCTQTMATKNLEPHTFCSSECQTDCCIKCICTQTLGDINGNLQCDKSNLCCDKCQTDFSTKCNCTQTTESGKCEKECQKNCCTKCNCSQTLRSCDALHQINKPKSNLCNDECQTDCCTKCNYSQTLRSCDASPQTVKPISSSCSGECQTNCCTKCNCSQTSSSCDTFHQTDKPKSNLCSDECQTGCYTKCNCSQTLRSCDASPQTDKPKSSKCKKGCQRDCYPKCDCEQTSKSVEAHLQNANRTNSKFCSDECQTECCTKCYCAQTTNNINSVATNCSNSGAIDYPNSEAKDYQKSVETDYPKSELSTTNSKSCTTMTMKRKRVTRSCCNQWCTNTKDAILVHGDIEITEMPHGPIKYVFQTEESDNTIRIHELSLNIKESGRPVSLDNILGKYFLKLKVNP